MGILADEAAGRGMLGTLLMMAGIIGLSALILISVRAKIVQRSAAKQTPRELIDDLKSRPQTVPHDDVAANTAQLIETAQRLAAQLDNKGQRLEILIQQADERLAALAGTGSAPPAPAVEPPQTHAEPEAEPPRDPLVRAVYDLADQGRNALEIARELDEQVGKVELILALRAA